MKKALIFDPYLDTLGGGERYTLTFALGLVQNGFDVEIAWPTPEILTQASVRFGLDFSSLHTSQAAHEKCSHKTSLLDRFFFTRGYDLVFWVSDGSIPFLFSKKNLIHFQVPFMQLGGDPFTNSLKSNFISKFVYNSEFTRAVHERHLDVRKSFVLYPPIDVAGFTPGIKENLILSVARFGSPSHSKRQDILIKAFKDFSAKISGYKLVLAGGVIGDDQVLQDLSAQARGLSIEIIPGPSFEILKSLYSKAKFFWHAAGYGIDESREPEKVEHFGMTTVEAMASGSVPVVIAKGGQREIITAESGFLCEDEYAIAENTAKLAQSPDLILQFSAKAIERSQEYSITKFYKKIISLL